LTLRDRDRARLVRGEPPRNLVLTRSNANYVYDSRGKKYIDFLIGEPAKISVKGLASAIEFEEERCVKNIYERCERAGLMFGAEIDTILLLPALTNEQSVAKRGLDILEDCL